MNKFQELNDITPFILTYIRLLLLFKPELSQIQENALLERQKQLYGHTFSDQLFDEVFHSSRKKWILTSETTQV